MRFKIFFIVLFLLAVGVGWYSRRDLANVAAAVFRQLPPWSGSRLETPLAPAVQKIQTPPPLRAAVDAPLSALTRAGTIAWTNRQRVNAKLPPLKENAALDTAAAGKVQDMFVGQYFAHVSPSGVGAAGLAQSAGYDFLAIGENIAVGNFADDQELLAAWMNSPGHRENVLSPNYTEIGVAVRRGQFEGKSTWLAVQEFGRPAADCPRPDAELKSSLEENVRQQEAQAVTLESTRAELEATRPKRGPEYRKKIEAHNAWIKEYNLLLKTLREQTAAYNRQVLRYNACLEG